MSIIKYDISNKILYDFLKIHCTLENNYYIFNNLIYKKYIYYDQVDSFINKLKDKYRKDQINYLTRNMTYNNLITIIRQICNKNKIKYKKQIKYDKSIHSIIYYIENIE
tara:strand:+ start:4018 stop:4344 length:327 start_codon:yes stop_codon:yes gene_type:complete